ncbi:MAG: hypothetical protein GQE15_39820 [Archangiaceae bacterium]|nr:hypothetical protein [Archangiaceae bacterium]
MQQPPPGRSNKTLLWVLLGVGGLCAVCGAGTVALFGLGVIAGATDVMGAGTASPSGTPGVAGGFSFTVPASFAVVSEGRWRFEKLDGDARHTAEVIKLAAIPGIDQPQDKLTQLWNQTIVRDWPGAPTRVLPLRRFVNNGARAYFTSASLKAANNKHPSLVSLYLVEADDRLEPFVVLQEYFDDSVGAVMMAKGSFDETQPAVEELMKGVEGSPVGLPLVSDDEIAGAWKYGTGSHAQYVNVITGSTSFSAVSYTVKYDFEANHDFSYDFVGANTQHGNTQFGGEKDTGTWRVQHDLLVLDGAAHDRRYFIVGAGVGPEGKRLLYLLPEPHWSLSPGAIAFHGELYEARED